MKKLNYAVCALVLAGAAASFVFTGCTSVQVSEQNSTVGDYKLGELQVASGHAFETAYLASKSGLKVEGLYQTGDNKKVVEAELKARDSEDTLVTVKIEEKVKGNAIIKIRYGVTGDLVKAQKLYQTIEKQW